MMGILNLTPDSFSDGQMHATLDFFLKKADTLIEDGADILDIGGESTRPDANPVDLEEERHRVLPFLKEFRKSHPHFPVSLDTQKYELAQECFGYGISILNDVSFLRDERFIDLIKQTECYYVLMHNRGNSKTMMTLTDYPGGVIQGICEEVLGKIDFMLNREVSRDRLILDIGFGFAKNPDQCVALMEHLSLWNHFNLPLLLGISRKRFLQKYAGGCSPQDRDEISAQLSVKACECGFRIFRTHNVRMTKEALQRSL